MRFLRYRFNSKDAHTFCGLFSPIVSCQLDKSLGRIRSLPPARVPHPCAIQAGDLLRFPRFKGSVERHEVSVARVFALQAPLGLAELPVVLNEAMFARTHERGRVIALMRSRLVQCRVCVRCSGVAAV